jgi:hypothetical protein
VKLADRLRGWKDDDTVRVVEYSNPLKFKREAKRLAKEGWKPTTQGQTRGFIIGLTRRITVTYEKDAPK